VSVIPGKGANSELVVEDQWFARMESNKLNGASRDCAVVFLCSFSDAHGRSLSYMIEILPNECE
jgi:hypothetical protein